MRTMISGVGVLLAALEGLPAVHLISFVQLKPIRERGLCARVRFRSLTREPPHEPLETPHCSGCHASPRHTTRANGYGSEHLTCAHLCLRARVQSVGTARDARRAAASRGRERERESFRLVCERRRGHCSRGRDRDAASSGARCRARRPSHVKLLPRRRQRVPRPRVHNELLHVARAGPLLVPSRLLLSLGFN